MKNLYLISLVTLIFLSGTPAQADTTSELKLISSQLCSALMTGDKPAFESLVADDHKQDIRWWWDASGKGKYFKDLYGKCEFDKIQDGSKPNRKLVFIQRYEKDGVTKWGKYGTVSFEQNKNGEWKIIGYSL